MPSPAPLRALLVCAALMACERAPVEADDPFDGTSDLAQALAEPCVAGDVCTATGDLTLFQSTYRLGTTATSRGELLQVFRATANGTPIQVTVSLRNLRAFTVPEAAGALVLHAGVYSVANPASPQQAGPWLAEGVVALNTFAADGTTVPADFGANGTAHIALEGSGELVAGVRYGLLLWTDALPAGSTGTLLVGVGALASTTYDGGGAFRAAVRRFNSTSEWGAVRMRPAGTYLVAMDLAVGNSPGAPSVVAVTPGNGSVTLAWDAPANDGGAPILDYRIVPSTGAAIVTSDASTTRTITGLTNGSSYTFTVAARNAIGLGPASDASASVVPRTVPGAPTVVSAIAGVGSVALEWNAPAQTGGAPVLGYTITASPGGAVITTGVATTTTFTGLTNDTTYTFTIAAANEAGTGPVSAPSPAATPRLGHVSGSGIITPYAGAREPPPNTPGPTWPIPEVYRSVVDGAGNVYVADANSRVWKLDAAGHLSVVAGVITAGFSGDGGLATLAQLNVPSDVALDGAGNLYIAEGGNQRVRKVNAATGIITTVAGTGNLGFSGDGGAATAAKLSSPMGLAADAAGNLYIADYGNNRVRKVTAATGVITTLVGDGTGAYSGDGGPATAAQVYAPSGVAVDATGNVFFASSINARVRKVEAATGLVSTVAGNGSAGTSGDGGPATSAQIRTFGIALDAGGNLYLAELSGARVRKVDALGVITTIAGTTTGFSGDGGPATAAKLGEVRGVAVDGSGAVYVADSGNRRLRRISGGIITTVAGTGSRYGDGDPAIVARLKVPRAVVMDGAGNLFVADSLAYSIRKVNAAGVMSTVVGTGYAGFSGDNGPAVSAQVRNPYGLALDGAGNLYIADADDHRIRKVSAAGIISTVAGTGVAGFSGDGGPATAAALNAPSGVAVDAAGNVFIADRTNHRIRQVSAGGIITTLAGTGTAGYSGNGAAASAGLNAPNGVAVDPTGRVLIADTFNNRIRRVDLGTGLITSIAGGGAYGVLSEGGQASLAYLEFPTGVATDTSGNVYFNAGNRIRMVQIATGIITTLAGDGTLGSSGDGGLATAARLNGPFGLTVTPDFSLYIADTWNYVVRRVH